MGNEGNVSHISEMAGLREESEIKIVHETKASHQEKFLKKKKTKKRGGYTKKKNINAKRRGNRVFVPNQVEPSRRTLSNSGAKSHSDVGRRGRSGKESGWKKRAQKRRDGSSIEEHGGE